MERIVNLHIEKLPEGVYLATSDVIQGIVVQRPFLTIQATYPKALCVLFSNKPACPQPSS